MDDYLYVALFLAIGVAFTAVTMWFSWLVRPRRSYDKKTATYECGAIPFGVSWRRFRANWFLYALIFVIFDVEVVFLFPWAKVLLGMKRTNPAMAHFAFFEMLVFIAILVVAYIYAWRKGAFVWD